MEIQFLKGFLRTTILLVLSRFYLHRLGNFMFIFMSKKNSFCVKPVADDLTFYSNFVVFSAKLQ